MSIEGSDTSSHIRQFGLYRTIDAKTEEFLKLSKRRQIKQGCACAAISTVITVAIVIGVIIIYEYSTISNSKTKNNVRQNWFNVMNNSLEAMPFEVKFDKTKLNPATFQILPLILKTIKKNVYFDKIIEDSVNLSNTYDKKESTEEISYKNAPEGTKNWVRFPVSKLYTIEYKTSPIFYFKNPAKNIEYFTKIRKIRDYQRVMNYVDKMISDKVSLGTTIPMAKYIYNAYRIPNIEYTTPIKKAKRGEEEFKNIKKKIITTDTKESTCSCKESVKDLLSKFITNLKELLPSATDQAHNTTTPCKVHQSIKQVKAYDKETQTINNSLNNSLHDTPTETSEQNSRLSDKYQIKNEKQHNFNKYTKPEGSIKDTSEKYDYSYKTFLTKQNLTDPYIKLNSYKHQSMTIQNLENESIENKEITTFPSLQTNYKDYISTESNIIDYFKILDAHSLELVKRKIIPGRKKMDLLKDKSDKSIMKNISSLLPVYNTSELGPKPVFFDNSKINDSEYMNIIPTTYTTARTDFIDTTIQKFTTDTTMLNKLETLIVRSYNSSTMKDSMFAFDNLTVEEEIHKISTENPEISIKKLENMIKKLNNSTVYNNSDKASEYEWELVNIVDDKYNVDVPNSMIPQSRSSYLEIQRNEWKNEEQHDYDNNLNNYLFE